MEKQELKSVIASLTSGDVITVTFQGDIAERSGLFTVVETKTGRGKGGSKLVVLRAADGTEYTTGTPENDSILHIITPDKVMHGYETEADVPKEYETDKDAGKRLKEVLSDLLDAEGDMTVTIDSIEPEFNGTFKVMQATQLRGRYGQIRVKLETEDGTTRDLWSFRHGVIISSVTIHEDDDDDDDDYDEEVGSAE